MRPDRRHPARALCWTPLSLVVVSVPSLLDFVWPLVLGPMCCIAKQPRFPEDTQDLLGGDASHLLYDLEVRLELVER